MKSKNILYLHGFRQNEQVMKFQTRKLRKLLPECNHHFINAPHISAGDPDAQILRHFKPPFYEHCQFEYVSNNKVNYYGIDETIDIYKEIANAKAIDGIVGFSQGTYIASILSEAVPLKFFVSVCGMQCIDDKYKIDKDLPSFHIIGNNDEWNHRGRQFHALYTNALLREHQTGHNFPTEDHIYHDLVSWLESI